MTEHAWCIPLKDAAGYPADLIGGKAAGLARLIALGNKVPAGFVVTTDCFRERANVTDHELQELLSATAADLGLSWTAVRSSASVEDAHAASWAGLFETYLGVAPASLSAHVRQCWESTAASRAAEYASHYDTDLSVVAMAVVVQDLIDATKAGTIFTGGLANESAIIIESVEGLGEALVSGGVTPETVVVDRLTKDVLERHPPNQDFVLTLQGGQQVRVARDAPQVAVLTEAEIANLLNLGLSIEEQFGSAVDIEWAIDSAGTIWVLQARPITASEISEARPYSDWDVNDLFRWGPTDGKYFYISDYVEAARRMTQVSGGLAFPTTVLTFEPPNMVWVCPLPDWDAFTTAIFRTITTNSASMDALRERYDAAEIRLDQFQDLDWRAIDDASLGREVQRFYDAMLEMWVATLPAEIGNYGAPGVLHSLLTEAGVAPEDQDALVADLLTPAEFTHTQAEEIELQEGDDLDRHHRLHRYERSSYSGVVEAPIEEFAQRRTDLPADIRERYATRIEQARSRLRAALTPIDGGDLVLAAGQKAGASVLWQDARKAVANKAVACKAAIVERSALRLGVPTDRVECMDYRALIRSLDTGVLPSEDLGNRSACMFPAPDEELSAAEAARTWAMFARKPLAAGKLSTLTGMVASRGETPIVTARARVVRQSRGATIEPGEILVASWTSPDYIELMRRAAAIVTDNGGWTCHAAVESRELHIPCIVGTDHATSVISDGQIITVDTAAGVIVLGPLDGKVDDGEGASVDG